MLGVGIGEHAQRFMLRAIIFVKKRRKRGIRLNQIGMRQSAASKRPIFISIDIMLLLQTAESSAAFLAFSAELLAELRSCVRVEPKTVLNKLVNFLTNG